MAMMDSIAATKARVDKLQRVAEEQKARKDEYAGIISQQSKGSFDLVEFGLDAFHLQIFVKIHYN